MWRGQKSLLQVIFRNIPPPGQLYYYDIHPCHHLSDDIFICDHQKQKRFRSQIVNITILCQGVANETISLNKWKHVSVYRIEQRHYTMPRCYVP